MSDPALFTALPEGVASNAYFSPCRTWRYFLHRIWSQDHKLLMVIGLNPSMADEVRSDPTVTRCINHARRWGFGGLVMLNAFAVRGVNPKILTQAQDPVGIENDYWLRVLSQDIDVGRIVLAWGNHGLKFGRQGKVLECLRYAREELKCFGYTNEGAPKHPLYLKQDQPLRAWGER